jgi:HlyD family secretion protein
LIFRGNIDETEVGKVKEGMPIMLTVGAINNEKFDAELEYISPKGVEQNGAVLFEIKAAVKVPDSIFIRAGYSANAEIVLSQATDVLTIPESTVEFSNDSAFVYIVKAEKPEQLFEKKHVTIGLSDGINIEIREGLTTEDKIRGNALDSKAKLDPKKK